MKGEAGGGAYNAAGTPQSIKQRIGRQRAVHSLCELRNASISAAAGGDQGKSSSALDNHKFGEFFLVLLPLVCLSIFLLRRVSQTLDDHFTVVSSKTASCEAS